MNKEMLAAWQLADDEYIRDLMNRREEMLRCANLFTDRINTTIDNSKAVERMGSYVADKAEQQQDQQDQQQSDDGGEIEQRAAA